MVRPALSDEDFIAKFRELGGSGLAKVTGTSEREIFRRRALLQKRYGIKIDLPSKTSINSPSYKPWEFPFRKQIVVKDGIVISASDFHFWPGKPTTMHRALVKMAKDLEPAAFILNGDVLDFPSVSRHGPRRWENRPKVADEIETAQDRLHEYSSALKRGCARIWVQGNHDDRFETFLAVKAPELAQLQGVHLCDHFPNWEMCQSLFINRGHTVVKHRFRGGEHGTHNNVIRSGTNIITADDHNARITPFNDYKGTRYGASSGMIADVEGPQFRYREDNPTNWRSAFLVLTFRDGLMHCPELVLKWNETHVEFRGQLIKC